MHLDDKGLIEQQITDWVREHVVISKPGFGRCRKLILRHLSIENKPQGDVQAFNIPNDEGLVGEIEMIVNKIVDAAQRNANDYASGMQKYALYAYYPDDQSYVPHKIFKVSAEDESDMGDLSPSEPPNEKGLTAQLMRHNEAIMKTAIMQSTFVFQIMQRETARLSDKDERNEKQRLDMILLQQETLNDAHARRLSERKEEGDIALREGVFEQLKVLMPIIANRVAGKQIFPEEDKSFLLMATLLENLTDEQQAFFRDSLNPAQTAVLAEILEAYEKKKEAFVSGKRDKPPGLLGQKNAFPPPRGQQGELPPLPEGSKTEKPMRLFSRLSERIAADPDTASSDPKLRKLEEQAAQFASRFADHMSPTKKD